MSAKGCSMIDQELIRNLRIGKRSVWPIAVITDIGGSEHSTYRF